jgi:hypothetical protein
MAKAKSAKRRSKQRVRDNEHFGNIPSNRSQEKEEMYQEMKARTISAEAMRMLRERLGVEPGKPSFSRRKNA